MAFIDGLADFLSTYDGVHTAFSFNQTAVNSGTDTFGANSSTYAQADTDNYPNHGLANSCGPSNGADMDIYILTDVCMLLYLPATGFADNTNYGLFHNGGGTHAQAGWCRHDSTNGWELCISHNQSGSNQDETYYTLGDVSGWYAVGFQFEDNSGNMALWVDGLNVSEVVRTFDLRYGSGNPQIGDSNGDHPTLWGAESPINGTGILIANMVVDNPNNDNTDPAGNGDAFYTDYYTSHTSSETLVRNVKYNGVDLVAKVDGVDVETAYYNGVLVYGGEESAPPASISDRLGSGFNEAAACADYNPTTSPEYWTDTDDFETATIIYADEAKTTQASTSYYSNGNRVVLWSTNSGGILISEGTC